MVREIRGAKINPKSFKNQGVQNTWGRKLREQIWYLDKNTDTHGDKYLIVCQYACFTLWTAL